jgi:hypothetical protein
MALVVVLGWPVAGRGRQVAMEAPVQAPATTQPGVAATAPAGTGLILGRVVDADSGRPVPRAIVTLGVSVAPRPRGSTGPIEPNRVMADDEGRFVFREVPAGGTSLSATKAGYLPTSFGQTAPVGPGRHLRIEEGERRSDVVLRMWQYAALSGTVADEFGDPAVGVRVVLVRRVERGGQRLPAMHAGASTDDRGVFRVGSLPPGDYFVLVPSVTVSVPARTSAMLEAPPNAQARQEVMQSIQESGGIGPAGGGVPYGDQVLQRTLQFGLVPPQPAANAPLQVYAAVYFPNESSLATATPVTLKSGEEFAGVHLRVRLTDAFRVSGVVMGPDGPVPNLAVRVVPADASLPFVPSTMGLETSVTVTDPEGRFTLLGVPPGSYLLRAIRIPQQRRPAPPPPPPPHPGGVAGSFLGGVAGSLPVQHSIDHNEAPPALSAELPLTVGRADVDGLTLTMASGGRLRGRVEFEGGAARPRPDELEQISISLQPVGSTPMGSSMPARPNGEGAFVTLPRPVGRYLANAGAPPGWFLKSITINGRDVTEVPFELTSADIDGVIVTYTDLFTKLTVSVTAKPADADEAPIVMAFPVDYQRWLEDGASSRRLRVSLVPPTGAVTLTGLPPGDYFVAAARERPPVENGDEADWAALAAVAVRASIRLGSDLSVTLGRIHRR